MEGEKINDNENKETNNIVSYDNTGRSNANIQPQIVYSPDPMSDLDSMKDGFIMQSFDTVEASSSCHSKNVYNIYGHDGSSNIKYLFKAKENSNTCTKWCIGADKLPIDIDIKTITFENGQEQRKTIIKLERPCSCCVNKAVNMKFTGEGNDNKSFGSLEQPCTMCTPKFEVKDENGNVKYVVTIPCKQTGFSCRGCCCCGGKELEFHIYGPEGKGDVVGKILRAGKKGLCHSTVDNYHVDFPDDASGEDKLRLICTGIICDYLFFEEDSQTGTKVI